MTRIRNILGPIFHIFVVCHYLHVMGYYSRVTFTKDIIKDDTDQRILDMLQFGVLFFTNWNLLIQMIYFTLAMVSDILRIFSIRPNLSEKIIRTKGYLFISFVFPCSVFVAGMFWSVYTINRELVLPEILDAIIPKWLNHSIHTNIVVFLILEVLVVNQLMPSFKAALIGLTVLTVIYDILFFSAYFYCGRWIYGLFYILTWPERIILTVFNYFITILTMKIGITIENFKYTLSTKNRQIIKQK